MVYYEFFNEYLNMHVFTCVRYTRNLFLRAFCVVYLSAFLSLYFQSPGLYGDNGVLPARSVLENTKHKSLSAKIHYQPTLLWLTPYLGLSTSAAIDVLSLLGVFLAFTGIVSQKFCVLPVFTALWSLFFSLFQIGQVFVSNCYDELLLEAGFLAIFMAPFLPGSRKNKMPALDMVNFWMCRLLLFRLLFTSALGKLLSDCPKWWSLSALSFYFETMPLPNPLSWYVHHLPAGFLKASTIYTVICELFVPFLFFVPVRSARITAFYLELFLQTCVVATGNFDHSNILIVTLLLTLLDDQFFYGKKKATTNLDILDYVLNVLIWIGMGFLMIKFFGIRFSDGVLDAHIDVSKFQFNKFVEDNLYLVSLLVPLSLCLVALVCTIQIFYNSIKTGRYFSGTLTTLYYLVVGIAITIGSTVAILSVAPKAYSWFSRDIQSHFQTTYNRLHKAHILNDYRLYPNVSGVEGRPEIILEGSDNLEGPWKEYNFLYKPGNVNHSLPFVAPYSPRLDWQMYWAARSTYNKQPWVLSLTLRLLTGNREVLNLIDRKHSPFPVKPPKYIRGLLYKYKFVTWSHRSQPAWWIREKVGDYFPPYTKDSPALEDFLKARNLLPASKPEHLNPIWKQGLDAIRLVANRFEATLLFWSVLIAALAIVVSTSSLS